jgi:hypothetical protein
LFQWRASLTKFPAIATRIVPPRPFFAAASGQKQHFYPDLIIREIAAAMPRLAGNVYIGLAISFAG